jgi:hypothetical protein
MSNETEASGGGPEKRFNPRSLWIVAVEFDKLALAFAMMSGVAVMLFNTWVLNIHDWTVVVPRSLLAFVTVWLGVFLMLFMMRQSTLRQIEYDLQQQVLADAAEADQDDEAPSADGESSEIHETAA